MSDFNRPEPSLEDRLRDYGAVLRADLDGAADADKPAAPMFLVTAEPVAVEPKRSVTRPAVTVVSIAAAVLLLIGVVVPGLTDRGTDAVTTTGLDVAGQPDGLDGPSSEDGKAAVDEAADGERRTPNADAADAAEQADDGDKKEDGEPDWSGFTVRTSEDAPPEEDDPAIDDETSADETTGTFAVLAGGSGAEGDNDKGDDEPADEPKLDDAVDTEDDKPDDKDDDKSDKPDDKPEEDKGSGDCPAGAVTFGAQCYEIVPPNCGDLLVSPTGDGCLKLVGTAAGEGACPGAYDLDGDTCVKHLPADVACSDGVPAEGACLIKFAATGGSTGCADGQLDLGGNCYELSAPTSSGCGDLQPLPDGQCRYPVSGESSTSCPSGFEPLGGDTCYRYEEGPVFTCDAGESDGAGWCKTTESGTPGPDVCDGGVEQDASGCFILVDKKEDGTCGELEELGDQCRKNKPSYPTWTCADGKTVYENACFVWTEATATCPVGEPVSGGTKCKTIVDAVGADGCPSYALEDDQGCYKSKPPTVNCGDLPVAPDGVNCKEWVGEASGSGGECPDGFELYGSYCKKYVDGTPSCSGATLVELAGKAKCRYTKPAGESGCASGHVEKAGKCYVIVAPSCHDLDVDVFGTGCKKPIA